MSTSQTHHGLADRTIVLNVVRDEHRAVLRAGLDPGLLDMRSDGVLRYLELVDDLAFGIPLGNEPDDLLLTRGQLTSRHLPPDLG